MADNRASIVIESKAAVAPGFRQVKREFDLLKSAGKQVNNVFTGIGQGIGQRFAGAAFDAIRGVTDLFTQAIPKALAYAKSIDEITDATGASAEKASILAGTLNILGVPTDSLATTFRTLSKEIISSENKFAALGVQVRDSEGNLFDTVTILDKARSALGQMEDGAAKTAIAVDLFGKSALGLIDYLNLSDEAASSAADELERMGLVLNAETITAAEDADRSFNLLGMTIDGLQITLANELLPAIINIVNSIRNWVQENREGLLKTLSAVTGAIGGFISGLLGATDAASGFINSLRGSSSAINTNKAGLQAQIGAIKQQIAAYKASGGASGGAASGASKITAAIAKQIQKLKDQREAINDVMRAQVAQANAAFDAMLSGLDASERQYELDERRKGLASDLADIEQEAADARIKSEREITSLRAERDLAVAGESDLDKQFQIAVDYAEREQRLVEQYAEDQTKYEKAVAEARANIAKFEADTKRQAAIDSARAQIETAKDLSQQIQTLALGDKNFSKSIADLRLIEQQQESALKRAIAAGDSQEIQLIEANLALIQDAIRTQQEAKEIAAHQKRLEREKQKQSAVEKGNDAFLSALEAQLDGLEKQLLAQDANTGAIKGFRGEARKTVDAMQTQTPVVESFATAFADAAKSGQDLANALKSIGDALGFLGTLGDILGAIASPFGLIGQNLGGIGQTLGDIFDGTPSPKTKKKPKSLPQVNGPRAYGGPVNAGDAFMVGEKGPELFLPNSAGMIVQGANAGGINITVSAGAFLGNTQDAKDFARRIAGALEDELSRRRKIQPNLSRRMAV